MSGRRASCAPKHHSSPELPIPALGGPPEHPGRVLLATSSYSLFFFFFPGRTSCGLRDLSSPTRDWTRGPAVKAPSPNHWTTREFPASLYLVFCTNVVTSYTCCWQTQHTPPLKHAKNFGGAIFAFGCSAFCHDLWCGPWSPVSSTLFPSLG